METTFLFNSTVVGIDPFVLHWLVQGRPYVPHLNIEGDELHLMHLGTTGYMLGARIMDPLVGVPSKPARETMEDVWMCVRGAIGRTMLTASTPISRCNLSATIGVLGPTSLTLKGRELKSMI